MTTLLGNVQAGKDKASIAMNVAVGKLQFSHGMF